MVAGKTSFVDRRLPGAANCCGKMSNSDRFLFRHLARGLKLGDWKLTSH